MTQNNISPIFILGIIIFIIPTLFNIFNITLPSWTNKVGLVLIVVGVIHMIIGRKWKWI
jgi:hypothetical protein